MVMLVIWEINLGGWGLMIGRIGFSDEAICRNWVVFFGFFLGRGVEL